MKKKKYGLSLLVLLFLTICVSSAFAAMGKLEDFTLTGNTGSDIVGDARNLAPDKKSDAEFSVKVSGAAGAISGFTLKNTATAQEWSTGGSGSILAAVDSKGTVINDSFPKVAFVLAADYRLYINGRDAIAANGGEFELTVKFVDGSSASAKTTVTPSQRGAAGVSVSGAASADAAATPVSAASQSGNAKLLSSEFKGVGGYDFSDGTKKLNSNMNPDYRFDISLGGSDTLTGIRIRSQGGGAAERIWDTLATTSNPLIVVTDSGKGTPLNKADGSIAISLSEIRDFNLWIDGSGDVAKQDFRLTFLYSGGRIEETDVKQAPQAAPATAPQSPAATVSDDRRRGRNTERSVQMSAKPVQIKLDVVGKNRLKKASGARDYSLVIRVRGQGKIEAIALANQTGSGKWDTIPDSKAWLMIVRKNNSQVNDSKDLSVSIPVSGSETLELLIEDDGTLAKSNARFVLSVTWDDGEITEEILTW
ncbi:MAG: hypothetical protein LBT31_05980 [Synergistaceae bacterium]|jgi:hypothetical protein|nr:hypothetical protein [Synergistaceae bacterium]